MIEKTESKREPLIKVTGLWSQSAGDGRNYFSGVCKEGEFKGYKFMVFQNTYFREGSRQPQFNLTAAKWVPVSYDDGPTPAGAGVNPPSEADKDGEEYARSD